jgi:N-dimethylarginine dimethylaminohydrolase
MVPQPDLPDLVFTANAGFVCGGKAVPSHFMPHERRPEEPYLEAWFANEGFELRLLPENVGFEGAGDCLIDRSGPWLWTGHGFRTEIEAHALLEQWFDREVVSIRLTDSRFYHIDTCFCPLSDGYLMYHPPAFDYDSRIAIEKRVPSHKRIVVDTEDAGNFACNAVNVDEGARNRAVRVPEGGWFGQVPHAAADRGGVLKWQRLILPPASSTGSCSPIPARTSWRWLRRWRTPAPAQSVFHCRPGFPAAT